ncbi:MAG: hypothetical protein HFJ50_01845 [Clostridia bacterium]|nr:hypothetical protein [Clostridia bacterium]
MDEQIIDNFKTSSMYHILAVSGTHIRNYIDRDIYII